jgi:hypothetical protein
MNRQDPRRETIRISSVAANQGQEVCAVCAPSNAVRIVRVRYIPDTQIVTSAAAGFVLALVNVGTAGASATTVASGTFNTAATYPAKVPISLALSSNRDVSAGEVLTWKESTVGTGTARANGAVVIEYIHL